MIADPDCEFVILPDQDQQAKRNALILAMAQAINGAVGPIIVSLGGLAGAYLLAADKSLATLPVSSYTIGMAFGAMPAALLMRRIGRRSGFICGSLVAITGALTATFALTTGQFWLLCVALIVSGGGAAFMHQYRFAAADQGSEAFKPKAISWVLIGGIGAAIIGPQTAIATKDLLSPTPYAGAFLAGAGLLVAGIAVLSRLRFHAPLVIEQTTPDPGRPLTEIVAQPHFIVAVICAIGAYALMAFVMTGAPLAMVGNGHSHNHAMLGIQWHVMAMFVPSFFTGNLINRFGKERVVATGLGIMVLCAAVGLAGFALWNFWLALVLLGIGWNFGFIGATAMLTDTYRESEKNKVQGLNDFLVFGSVAAASLMSGQILNAFGWHALQWTMFPVLAACLLALLWLAKASPALPTTQPPQLDTTL